MMCCNPKFCRGPNLSFFGLGPWGIIHGIAKSGNTFISQIWFLMTPFELFFSRLSENLTLDPRNSSYGIWKSCRTIDGGCSWTALTLVPLIQFQNFYDFQKNTFQMMCFNPKRCRGPNLSFFNLGLWAIIIHGIAKFIGLPNMIPFERSLSKLSESYDHFRCLSQKANIYNQVFPLQLLEVLYYHAHLKAVSIHGSRALHLITCFNFT